MCANRFPRIRYIESNIEEFTDMKLEIRLKNLPRPVENTEGVCKSYVDFDS